MKRTWYRWAATALVAVVIIGCETVPETGRKQLNFIPAGEEMQLGLTSFNQLKQQTPISRDPAANALVQKVGRKIASVAQLPNAQWEFVVFESKEANAFCLPGGKVGVYTGLLPITRDEAGLATVIGHEVGHAVAHHGAERMSEATVMQGLGQVAGSMVDPKYAQAFNLAYGLGSTVGVELPHSRRDESEADQIGLTYMARAGYDPRQALDFWNRFRAYNAQAGASGGPAFLRTHPTDEQRIAQLQKLLPAAEQEYARATGQGVAPAARVPYSTTPSIGTSPVGRTP